MDVITDISDQLMAMYEETKLNVIQAAGQPVPSRFQPPPHPHQPHPPAAAGAGAGADGGNAAAYTTNFNAGVAEFLPGTAPVPGMGVVPPVPDGPGPRSWPVGGRASAVHGTPALMPDTPAQYTPPQYTAQQQPPPLAPGMLPAGGSGGVAYPPGSGLSQHHLQPQLPYQV